MNKDLLFYLATMTRFVYYVTEEDDVLINDIATELDGHLARVHVFNPVFGLQPIKQYQQDFKSHTHKVHEGDMLDTLKAIYMERNKEMSFYIILDADRYLGEEQVQRAVLNLAHQSNADNTSIKLVIFVSNRLAIPRRLQRYICVAKDQGLSEEQHQGILSKIIDKLPKKDSIADPCELARHFRGLTSFETRQAVFESLVKSRGEAVENRIDPKTVADFRRQQLSKTELLTYIDVTECTFDKVGGNDLFKRWASKNKNSWTAEGQKFGLIPPKGILAVGVWGCGKSLSIKALANAWKLPMVVLETGKLRSSGVGESEANVYKALSLIEAVSPCIVMMDEAEKTLSGGASSAVSDAGTTSRITGILSTWIQETKAPVCFAMSANSLKGLPVEFVNRMDERFFFDLPSYEERIDILKIHLKQRGQEPHRFQLAELSEVANNMVGREIEQAIGAAMTESFYQGKESLDHQILAKELKTKPRIFKTVGDDLREILEWVGYDPDVDDGVRARFASSLRSEGFKKYNEVTK